MNTFETLKAGTGDAARRPLAPVTFAALVVIWWVLVMVLAGLPLNSILGLLGIVVLGMLLLGAAGFLLRLSFTLFRRQPGNPNLLPGSPAFWIAVVVFLAGGVLLPGALISWTPAFEGRAAQALSAALRFGVAMVTGCAFWLWFCAVVRRIMESDGTQG